MNERKVRATPSLFLVSNRLPVTVERRRGGIQLVESIGGVATGLQQFQESMESQWIGWPGIARERLSTRERLAVARKLRDSYQSIPVYLRHEEIEGYYNGFCNSTIWPLFHYFPQHARFHEQEWEMFRKVNERFAREVLRHITEEDTVWVHDFHLFLLPQMLRKALPRLSIGFFLHIPFPSFEILRQFPWREQILTGIAGADLVGFHTYDDVLHFLRSMERTLGLEHEVGRIALDERIVRVDAFPLGIDFEHFVNQARDKSSQQAVRTLQRQFGERRIILSIDRLDYTKGITQRLHAFRDLLQRFPQYRNKVSLLLVVPPSRTKVQEYRRMREEIDTLVGSINGMFGTLQWTPVRYLSRTLDFRQLVNLYSFADIALVTPLRDGMNLISKEFLACKLGNRGVLVLSEMAGAAKELSEAILVNPVHRESMVRGLLQALRMPVREQRKRNRIMRSSLKRRTLQWWGTRFLAELRKTKSMQTTLSATFLRGPARADVIRSFREANKRLLFLDYDGTLSAFRPKPEQAKPTARVLTLLRNLSELSTVVLSTGRTRPVLERWFGHLPIGYIAEHGNWVLKRGGKWRQLLVETSDWKPAIRDILEQYVDITPGSFIEEKENSLAWHCRQVDTELIAARTPDLLSVLRDITANYGVDVREGKRVIEVKTAGTDKGKGAQEWLDNREWDFILAVGDDWTDEDLFRVMPANAITIKVGPAPSIARYRIPTYVEFLSFLEECMQKM